MNKKITMCTTFVSQKELHFPCFFSTLESCCLNEFDKLSYPTYISPSKCSPQTKIASDSRVAKV